MFVALRELEFTFSADKKCEIKPSWSHYGVVGSGDLEILMEKCELGGATKIKIATPVVGFDKVWEKVSERFVQETGISNVCIEINDNNATPIVVHMRLRQAFAEANAQEEVK